MPDPRDKKIEFLEGVIDSQRQLLNSMANYLKMLQEQLDSFSTSIGGVLESHNALELAQTDAKKEKK